MENRANGLPNGASPESIAPPPIHIANLLRSGRGSGTRKKKRSPVETKSKEF